MPRRPKSLFCKVESPFCRNLRVPDDEPTLLVAPHCLSVVALAPGRPAALAWTLRWDVVDELATALSRSPETEAWARIMSSWDPAVANRRGAAGDYPAEFETGFDLWAVASV